MTTIPVRLNDNSYSILVGDRVLSSLPAALKRLGLGQDAVVITNPSVRRLHGRTLAAALRKGGFSVKFFEIEDSERAKSADVAFRVIGQIVRYASDKKPFVVAFGGGVVGDLAGFVAAVTKRGIPLVQVPTTLLAQIDSSIGGKVAVDLPEGKNLVGAFYQPRLVFADVSFLTTLSDRQVRNGLAEAIKYGAILDAGLFVMIEKNFRRLLAKDTSALAAMVARCAAIKARIVSRDERETKGLRTVLNFGHTVGHAIEAAAGYGRYHHGEAVALGMRAAAELSVRLRLLKAVDAARLNCLISAAGLPERVEGVASSKIFKAMSFDKKFSGKINRFVLLKGIGQAVVRENVPPAFIAQVLA